MHLSPKRKIQVSVSTIAILVALVHIIFPKVSIDAITVSLLVVAVVPWLAPLFKSLQLPGGLKVEFQDLEKVSEQAIQADLITKENIKQTYNNQTSNEEYSFVKIAEADQGLALTGLRIEIEKTLRVLARHYGFEDKNATISRIIQNLAYNDII